MQKQRTLTCPPKQVVEPYAVRVIIAVAIACSAVSVVSPASATEKVRVLVRVPANSPTAANIYLTGSHPNAGSWKPDGVKLKSQLGNTYAGEIELPIPTTLEFKFTRGDWGTVEKNADGTDRPNRRITIDASTRQIDATVERWGTGGPNGKPASTVVGMLKLHTIDSRFLERPRIIRVWLPPGYDTNKDTRYSVLYMHDGQNCFDRQTSAFGNEWEIDETISKLIRDKRIPPIIVIAVDNGLANRVNELTFAADAKHGGGQGAKYADFLLTEVKPFIEKTYRADPAREHTFIGGSSLGGIASLEIARRHPKTFGGVIAMSPALRWADESTLNEIKKDPGGLSGARVWIDMGVRENIPDSTSLSSESRNQELVDAARRIDKALTDHHIEHRLTIDDQHAEHNEAAWASRFPQAITYILDAK